MKRFIDPAPQFMKEDGELLSNGKIYFLQEGSSDLSDTKAIYLDEGGVTQSINPITLPASGVMPNVFGVGKYTVKLYDSDLNLLRTRDVDFDAESSQFDAWNSAKTYSINEIAKGDDGEYYLSLKNNNKGNDPTSPSSGEFWSRIAFFEYFNPDRPGGYPAGAVVVDSGLLYSSNIDDNTDTPPSVNWNNLNFGNPYSGSLSVLGSVTASSFSTDGSVTAVDSFFETVTVSQSITAPDFGVARRQTTLSIVSDTTLNLDPDLTITGLFTGWYFVNGIIQWNSNSGGAGNRLQVTMDGDASTQLQQIVWQDFDAAALSSVSTATTPNFQNAGATDRLLIFSGMIRLDTGDTLGLWVSQFTSSATAIDIKRASLTVRRVGDGV